MYNAQTIAACREGLVRIHTFVKMELDTGDVLLWDGPGDSAEFDGDVYLGVGTFGQIDYSEDGLSELARPFSMTLSGSYIDDNGDETVVDGFADAVGRTLTDTPLQGRLVTVKRSLCHINTYAPIEEPIINITGRIDKVTVTEDERLNVTMSVSLEDPTLLFARRSPRKYNLASHHEVNPDSTLFKTTASLDKQQVKWGVA